VSDGPQFGRSSRVEDDWSSSTGSYGDGEDEDRKTACEGPPRAWLLLSPFDSRRHPFDLLRIATS